MSIKTKIRSLIAAANAKTGKSDTDLTTAVQSLISETGGITPSGTLPINKNGTHDVTQYAEAEVNVPIPEGYIVPTGSKTITSNGEVDITNYAKVKVAIPSGSEVLF